MLTDHPGMRMSVLGWHLSAATRAFLKSQCVSIKRFLQMHDSQFIIEHSANSDFVSCVAILDAVTADEQRAPVEGTNKAGEGEDGSDVESLSSKSGTSLSSVRTPDYPTGEYDLPDTGESLGKEDLWREFLTDHRGVDEAISCFGMAHEVPLGWANWSTEPPAYANWTTALPGWSFQAPWLGQLHSMELQAPRLPEQNATWAEPQPTSDFCYIEACEEAGNCRPLGAGRAKASKERAETGGLCP